MEKIFFTGVSLEIEERAKRRKRKGRTGGRKALKKPKAGRRPAKGGKGNKGCGTGAGGFAAGNQCALEDGVPQPLKQVNVKKTRIKAKQLAVKEQAAAKAAKMKQAVKRVVKKMRDNGKKIKIQVASGKLKVTGTGQNVADAIKLMKADKDLKIVGTPKSIKQQLEEMKKRREAMRNNSPKTLAERELDYIRRRYEPEFKQFDKANQTAGENFDKTFFPLQKKIADNEKKAEKLSEDIKKSDGSNKKELQARLQQLKDERLEASLQMNEAIKKHRADMHANLSKFTKSVTGSHTVSQEGSVAKIGKEGKRSPKRKQFEKDVNETFGWFDKHVSSAHQKALDELKIAQWDIHASSRTQSFEGAYHVRRTRTLHFGNKGDDYFRQPSTIAHEVGHGLHQQSPNAEMSITAFHKEKVFDFLEKHPEAKLAGYKKKNDHYRGYRLPGQGRWSKSNLGYYSHYSDFDNATSRSNNIQGIEVPSVGMEAMYEDPVSFYQKNRDHYDITAAFMAGMLNTSRRGD